MPILVPFGALRDFVEEKIEDVGCTAVGAESELLRLQLRLEVVA